MRHCHGIANRPNHGCRCDYRVRSHRGIRISTCPVHSRPIESSACYVAVIDAKVVADAVLNYKFYDNGWIEMLYKREERNNQARVRCGANAPVRCKAPSDASGIAPVGKNDAKKGEVYGAKSKAFPVVARRRSEPKALHGGKKVKGRKRHILVDTLGLLLEAIVTEANGSERINGLALLLESQENLDL